MRTAPLRSSSRAFSVLLPPAALVVPPQYGVAVVVDGSWLSLQDQMPLYFDAKECFGDPPRDRESWLYSRSRVLRGGRWRVSGDHLGKHRARRVSLGGNRIGIILRLGRLSVLSVASPR